MINDTEIKNWKSDNAIVFNNGNSKVINTNLVGDNAILINAGATVNLTKVNNTAGLDADYSVYNKGTLYLYTNLRQLPFQIRFSRNMKQEDFSFLHLISKQTLLNFQQILIRLTTSVLTLLLLKEYM